MTEALNAAVDYWFTRTDSTWLACCHAVENPASGRVMQKAGFAYHHDDTYHKFDGTPVPPYLSFDAGRLAGKKGHTLSELYDILVETPPTPTLLLALDQGAFDSERSLQELAALCEANHMQAVGEVVQKRSTPETGTVLGSGKLEEARLAAEWGPNAPCLTAS